MCARSRILFGVAELNAALALAYYYDHSEEIPEEIRLDPLEKMSPSCFVSVVWSIAATGLHAVRLERETPHDLASAGL